MPRFSEDDVLDFIVLEALTARAARERAAAEKDRERQQWMGSHKDWAKKQGLAGGGR